MSASTCKTARACGLHHTANSPLTGFGTAGCLDRRLTTCQWFDIRRSSVSHALRLSGHRPARLRASCTNPRLPPAAPLSASSAITDRDAAQSVCAAEKGSYIRSTPISDPVRRTGFSAPATHTGIEGVPLLKIGGTSSITKRPRRHERTPPQTLWRANHKDQAQEGAEFGEPRRRARLILHSTPCFFR